MNFVEGEGFLRVARVLDQTLPRLVAQLAGVGASGRGEAGSEHDVEVIATDHIEAARSHDLVERTRGGHDRGVEGAAAQVVDEDRCALGIEGASVTMRVLEARGGRFVDHRENVPTRPAEGLKGKESLRRPRVSRDADESLERLRIGQRSDGGVGAQLAPDVAEETRQRVEDRDAVIAQTKRGGVSHRRIGQ